MRARLGLPGRHPTRLNVRQPRPITLCEAVARVERCSYWRALEVAQGDDIESTVARWKLGQACTAAQWAELIQLCLSRGPVVHRFVAPWEPPLQ